MNIKAIGFIGFGMIAGDIARCIHENAPDVKLYAYNHHHPQVKEGLRLAKEQGVLTDIESDFDHHMRECDLIYLCAPVIQNVKYLPACKAFMKKDAIITDVGSVKGNIHKAVKELDLEASFIGGHPMAGTEKTGFENSSDDMLKGAFYLLTPTDKTPQRAIDLLEEIAGFCQCKTMILTPEDHDMAAAAISHVPHILSYSLVNTVRLHDNDQQYMKQFAAGGFRDMTRIAASSPDMWQNIVLANKKAVLTFLSQYQVVLEEFKQMLINEDADGLWQFFKDSKDYRDTFKF